MIAHSPAASSLSLPIGGVSWLWRDLKAEHVDEVLPLVLALEPGGREAASWRADVAARLGTRAGDGGVVIVQCRAGLTLAFFFHTRGRAPDGRPRLEVDRLRWLEIGRPHRSLDALLAVVLQTADRLACAQVMLLAGACVERQARAALDERAAASGFEATPEGWYQVISKPC